MKHNEDKQLYAPHNSVVEALLIVSTNQRIQSVNFNWEIKINKDSPQNIKKYIYVSLFIHFQL